MAQPKKIVKKQAADDGLVSHDSPDASQYARAYWTKDRMNAALPVAMPSAAITPRDTPSEIPHETTSMADDDLA